MNDKQKKVLSTTSNIVGIILCVILVPILLCNLILIAKSFSKPNEVPDIFGIKPFIVLSPSMQKPSSGDVLYDNHINVGDLIFVKAVNPDSLKVGDIITYREKGTTTTTTHRIVALEEKDGETVFITKGDNNNSNDAGAVFKSQVEGIYVSKIAKLGNFAMFIQEPTGIIIFITVPLGLFFISYMIKNKGKTKTTSNKDDDEQAKLLKEKEELQKQLEIMKNQIKASTLSEEITTLPPDTVINNTKSTDEENNK